jgi:hypothetical protein
MYGGQEVSLVGYADADGSMVEDRHTISGYAFLIDGGAVSWSTKRQEIVLLLTTESEYMYCGCTGHKRSPLAPFVYHSTFQAFSSSNNTLFGQSIDD